MTRNLAAFEEKLVCEGTQTLAHVLEVKNPGNPQDLNFQHVHQDQICISKYFY